MRVGHVVILGGGSAGFLVAITLRTKVPDLRVTVIRSKDIGIIGVGEGTTVLVPSHLHRYLGIDRAAFYAAAKPVWKLGIRFLWGPRPQFNYTFTHQLDAKFQGLPRHNGFYCDEQFDYTDLAGALMQYDRAFARRRDGLPLVTDDHAYHLENADLVVFLESHAAGLGVRVVDDTVVEVRRDTSGDVAGLALAGGCVETGELYVDCSGFASVLLGKTLGEPFVSFAGTLFCDRAVVGG
jgi:tryptophan 7-halogenase